MKLNQICIYNGQSTLHFLIHSEKNIRTAKSIFTRVIFYILRVLMEIKGVMVLVWFDSLSSKLIALIPLQSSSKINIYKEKCFSLYKTGLEICLVTIVKPTVPDTFRWEVELFFFFGALHLNGLGHTLDNFVMLTQCHKCKPLSCHSCQDIMGW